MILVTGASGTTGSERAYEKLVDKVMSVFTDPKQM